MCHQGGIGRQKNKTVRWVVFRLIVFHNRSKQWSVFEQEMYVMWPMIRKTDLTSIPQI